MIDDRWWNDYELGRAPSVDHLIALDGVYHSGIISDHRRAISATSVDPVTEDLLIGQNAKLELFQWFVRWFVESQPISKG